MCLVFPSTQTEQNPGHFTSLDSDRGTAEQGLLGLVREVVDDLEATGEAVPEPFGTRKFSGKFNVRTLPSLHRSLVMAARAEGVSLNAYINQKLASA